MSRKGPGNRTIPRVPGIFHVSDYINLALNVGQATEDWQPAIQRAIDDAANYKNKNIEPSALNGLSVWFDATKITGVSDGATIQTWNDLSGFSRNATQATVENRPTYLSSGLNGRPAIDFNGIANNLKTATLSSLINQPVTIYIAASFESGYLFDGLSTAYRFNFKNSGSYFYMGTSSAEVGGPASDTNLHIFKLVFNGANSKISIDNATPSSTTLDTNGLDGLTIGSLYGNNNYGKAKIGEIILYNRLLSTDEESKIYSYLENKWLASEPKVVINNVAKVMFDLRRYKIRKPIIIPGMGITLEGIGYSGQMPDIEYTYNGTDPNTINCTVIEKTTSTTLGPKTRSMRYGTVTDNLDVDSIIIVDHPEDDWAYNVVIRNMFLRSRTATGYGIYAPRMAYSKIENVMVYKALTGFFTYDTWQSKLSNVKVRDAQVGFKFSADATTNACGTSIHFEHCFADTCSQIGFDITRLNYSTMTGCAADHCTGAAYKFYQCDGITLNGCGAEDTKENTDVIILDNNTYAIFNGFSTFQLTPATSGSHSVVNCVGNGVMAVFNACKFVDYTTTPDTAFNKSYIAADNCNLEFRSCRLQTTSGEPVVGAGSRVHIFDLAGYKQVTSEGTKIAALNDGTTANTFYVQSTEPTNPRTNDVWIQT